MRKLNLARCAKYLVVLAVAVFGPGLMAAKADTIWTFEDATFNRPGFGTNTVTGSFTFNSTFTALDGYNVTVAGTGTQTDADTTYVLGDGTTGIFDATDTTLDFYDFSTGQSIGLVFADALTNAGGTDDLLSGSLVCPGCGTANAGAYVTTNPDPPSVPEPGSLSLLACGLLGLGLMFAKRRVVLS